jgi:hypothetical protein
VILGINTIATEDDYTRRVLAATGTNYFDVFSFHEYNESFFGGVNNVAQARAEKFRQMQEDYGPSRPLWISEGGPGVRSGSLYNIGGLGRSPRDQMAHAVRMEASLIAAGIQKFFHYSMEINAPPGSVAGPYDTLENDRSPRALLVGRAVLASLIDGAISIGRTEPAPGVEAYTFQQTDGSVVTVIWSYDGLTHTLSLARGTILLDILRNEIKTFGSFTVGDEPVYVEQFLRPQIRRQETPPRRIGP